MKADLLEEFERNKLEAEVSDWKHLQLTFDADVSGCAKERTKTKAFLATVVSSLT